ncbi:lytic transglycosylase domain-containing protein [Herbiconiux ginsengi]|uniref:lytic transglycosylase domain-containing protein n=1 Tax=Herbiconiux ginsengi TaxID=381665 RepID=UPI000B8A3C53|nr:lytic transglycosylase domain-containing protein [Herbiconiux ginsengi]
MGRTTATLVCAAFLIAGVVGWIAGMPKPSEAVPYAFAEIAPTPGAVQARTGSIAGGGAGGSDVAATQTAPPVGSATDGIVSAEWMATTSAATGIPVRALQAYAVAARTLETRAPQCHLGWNTLAALGERESAHGTHEGAHLDAGGQLIGQILGPVLDGSVYDAVPDTDGGRWDGDAQYDRAVGPLQFIPATWTAIGEDGSGDSVADPNQIDDAALSAGIYLCASGGDLSTADGWASAVRAYNTADDYLPAVRKQADDYARLAG